MELTTVWSGAHKHTYLCIHEPTVVRTTPDPERPAYRIPVLDILPTHPNDALTQPEIQARTGATDGSIVGQLHRLRCEGVLGQVAILGHCGKGRRPQRYWRKGTV